MDLSLRLSEGEQNRLVVAHMEMVRAIASGFRGKKDIPFEELCSQGTLGLVLAARSYIGAKSQFGTWATIKIRSAIIDFIDGWQEFVSLDGNAKDDEDRVHWWDIWADIPYEGWHKLPATPEEIVAAFDDIVDRREAFNAALLSLSRRDRKMIEARFLRSPRVSIDQIARDNALSYRGATKAIVSALRKMRGIVQTIETRRPAPVRAS